MRILMTAPALLFIAAALGGCNTGAPEGVLPRDPVPPPPSTTGNLTKRPAAAERADVSGRRRALSVPERLVPPRPSASRPAL